MGKISRSGSEMNTLNQVSEHLAIIFLFKILIFFDVDADPGSGNLFEPGSGREKIGSGIRDKRPGSARPGRISVRSFPAEFGSAV
jgi:hypothetical protein